MQIQDLIPGITIDNETLNSIFKCGNHGRMRRSLKTNSLVLILRENDNSEFLFNENDGLWNFVGIGENGDQSLDYLQNKTLLNSNTNGVKVYLFNIDKKGYQFINRVLLAREPYMTKGLDSKGQERGIWNFSLIEVGKEMEIVDFLQLFELDFLIDNKILDPASKTLTFHSVEALIGFMKIHNIDTLTANNGWFLNTRFFFHNPLAKSNQRVKNLYDNEGHDTDFLKENCKQVFYRQNKYLNPYLSNSLVYSPIRWENNDINKKGFRILKLKYRLDEEAEEVVVDFMNKNQFSSYEKPFISLLIGPNGTGKSTIISIIQQIITDMYRLSESRQTSLPNHIDYTLVYKIGEHTYSIIKDKNGRKYAVNNKEISFGGLILPKKTIACAYSITDRFSYNKTKSDYQQRYEYLGVKSYSKKNIFNETSINLVENILTSSLKNEFVKHMKYILNFLELDAEFRIRFDLRGKFNSLDEEQIKTKQRQSKKSEVDSAYIMDFLHNIKKYNEFIILEDESLIIQFDSNKEITFENYYQEFHAIKHLYSLRFLSNPEVYIKKGTYFPLRQTSSGESQYFTSIINILSKMEDNTLVLIDEPETSLHPNWQYKYIHGLYEIFKKLTSCHFILVTHSHFMVSELDYQYSSILSLKRNGNLLPMEVTLHNEDTYGWSVEDVLYNIFDMATNRNYYLADELDSILLAISVGDIGSDILEKVSRIKESLMHLKTSDPMREIIELIVKKVDAYEKK
ncbi:AAA family ATPase [Bacillus thuringiensis]|uniref:AAA family ATPase n=1 Tax=Bacillus thuringiensis TaxID=1428 RepID=UPI000BF83CC9|nr:AAA family ATPase [Bacillus thuringiensis]PFJ08890.1 hypothetical protein COI87_24830 [Bacillus thuringiensis]